MQTCPRQITVMQSKCAKTGLIRDYKYNLVKKKKGREKKSDPHSLVAMPEVALFANR